MARRIEAMGSFRTASRNRRTPRQALVAGLFVVGAVAVLMGSLLIALPVPSALAAPAPLAQRSPEVPWTGVSAVSQTPMWVTAQDAFTVNLTVEDGAAVKQITYTFCELSQSVCFIPVVVMTQTGADTFAGATKVMAEYGWLNGKVLGSSAGYNISINYQNGTNTTEPSGPTSTFPDLLVTQSVSGENLFEMSVRNPLYGLTGTVTADSTGAALSGANVTLTSSSINRTTTSATGSYSFANLLNGTYTLSVSAAGYRTSNQTVKVNGNDAVQSVKLSNTSAPITGGGSKSSSFLGMTGTELAIAAVVVVVVVALALVLLARRRSGGGGPRGGAGAEPPAAP